MNQISSLKNTIAVAQAKIVYHQDRINTAQRELASLTITSADITPGAVFSQDRRPNGTAYKTVVREEGGSFSLLGVDFNPFSYGGVSMSTVTPHNTTKEALAKHLTAWGYVKAGRWELKK